MAAAAAAFQVTEPALWVILRVEGGRVGACTPNTNGTRDCGPAQINVETWAPSLARLTGRTAQDVAAALRDDGCFNVHAAAYVLRVKLGEARGDAWDAAGRYNSATPVHKRAYQSRLVAAHAQLLLGGRPRSARARSDQRLPDPPRGAPAGGR